VEANVDKHFTKLQVRSFLGGTLLGAEIPASTPERRAYVIVAAYDPDDPLWKWREDLEVQSLRFRLYAYEVQQEDAERRDLDAVHYEIRIIRGVRSTEALANVLSKFLDDFSALDGALKVVPA
jgi:hypothetical protein